MARPVPNIQLKGPWKGWRIRNELLIGLDPLVRAGALDSEDLAPLRALPRDHVDYGTLIPLKRGLLFKAAARFRELAAPDVLDDFARFLEENDEACATQPLQ